MDHNSEHDAIDLLNEVDQLTKLEQVLLTPYLVCELKQYLANLSLLVEHSAILFRLGWIECYAWHSI